MTDKRFKIAVDKLRDKAIKDKQFDAANFLNGVSVILAYKLYDPLFSNKEILRFIEKCYTTDTR